MMVWPPYDDPFAYKSLSAFRGNKLIFIGEGAGGCTGDDDFFNLLCSQWQEVTNIGPEDWEGIPNWHGIHDRLHLYSRK